MADLNAESIQQKIQIARRDAEALKDRIKRKKDELADTTRTCTHPPARQLLLRVSLADCVCSARCCPAEGRTTAAADDED